VLDGRRGHKRSDRCDLTERLNKLRRSGLKPLAITRLSVGSDHSVHDVLAPLLPRHDFRERSPDQVRVAVFGATGYIGRFVVKELVERGYQVMAFARESSGIGGRQGQAAVVDDFPGADVRFGDVTNPVSLATDAFNEPTDVVISCLASRTGGKKDSWAIDYAANLNAYNEGKRAGVAHLVMLSAICVQKPILEFQKAKLSFENLLRKDTEITHTIVRPTAFFKSIAGQFESCKKGAPYVMFGNGELTRCKPISEKDLACFLVNCVNETDKVNQVLPIGGPGPALSARTQGEILFKTLGRSPRMLSLPMAMMNAPTAILEKVAMLVPALEDTAEFARIGCYYASESMLVWDEKRKCYDPDATPSFGDDTLEQFFERVNKEGMAGQELGDAAIFKKSS
jgi:divinyl chlorophyllide a 8-vinyl-reductase